VIRWPTITLPALAALLLAPASARQAAADPLWQRLLSGKATVRDHLRLAEGHERAGRCGAAVYHYRRYLAKGASPDLRERVQARLQRCLKRSSWNPEPPVLAPAGPRPPRIWRPASPRARIPTGWIRLGSAAAERGAVRSLCRRRTDPKRATNCRKLDFSGERSPRTVRVKAFRIDRTEVTWARYLRCVRAGACRSVPSRFPVPADQRLPVVGVSHTEARAFCRWAKGRLPTDTEWTAAARGSALPVRLFPWGRHAVVGCAHHGRRHPGKHSAGKGGVSGRSHTSDRGSAKASRPAAVGTHPCDASATAVLDLAGNVREWVVPDAGATTPGRKGAAVQPVRGGSFRLPEWRARAAARQMRPATSRAPDLGFRCVWPVAPSGSGEGS
jgi:formylglycine-generating enzyme required for sulfatase activity